MSKNQDSLFFISSSPFKEKVGYVHVCMSSEILKKSGMTLQRVTQVGPGLKGLVYKFSELKWFKVSTKIIYQLRPRPSSNELSSMLEKVEYWIKM